MNERNELYPIFLKTHELNTLIVGGGNVGLEKLTFLLKSSPNSKVTMVAKEFLPETIDLALNHHVKLIKAGYHSRHLEEKHIVIAATGDEQVNLQISKEARQRNILVNVADTPGQCDFYMGGIVTKGNVKLAISTNGKSPTTAKRLRQFFEQVIPDDIDQLVKNLNSYRKTISGNFADKVEKLNRVTKNLVE